MKRHLVLLAIVCSAYGGSAVAQSYELRAGSNASLSGNTFQVGPGSFSVEVWFNVGATPFNNSAYYVALGFDAASSDSDTSANHGKFSFSGAVSNLGSPYQAMNHSAAGAFRDAEAGSNNPLSGSERPWGIYSWTLVPPPGSQSISGNVLVATYTFANHLAFGDTYGDNLNETGLIVYNQGGDSQTDPGLRSSGYAMRSGSTTHGRRAGSMKYIVQSVPEPGTLIALAAGAAAFLQRRRKVA